MENITFELVKSCIIDVLKQFYKEDNVLFDFKTEDKAVCERSMVFRIGIYLNQIIKENNILEMYDVDCEYNRSFNHPKFMYKETLEEIEKVYTYPDLIVHKRRNNYYNLLIFEFKKGKQSKDKKNNDIEKLKYFTDSKKEYNYKYGFYVELFKNYAAVHVLINGVEKSNLDFRI